MATKSLHEIAAAVFKINRSVPLINNGGCGLFAATYAKELQRYGWKAKVVSLTDARLAGTYSKKDHRHKVNVIRNNRKNNTPINEYVTSCHYAVKIGRLILDSRGVFEIERKGGFNNVLIVNHYYSILGVIPIEDIDYLNQFREWWNDEFNFKKHGTKLVSLIKSTLKKVHAN